VNACRVAALVLTVMVGALVRFHPVAHAQGPPSVPAAQRLPVYPDRPKAPQAVLDRGKALFGVNCAFCHGSDAGGGEGGPNLLRSGVVLEDQFGEIIAPIVHGARVDKGMPRIDLTDMQISDVAAWLHSLRVASRTDPNDTINIVTGDPAMGKADFQRMCASCHSVTGDLKGISSTLPNPKVLQQNWILPGGAGRPGQTGSAGVSGVHVPPITVTVTLAGGRKVSGTLERIDDFFVGLRDSDGTVHGFTRTGDTPKVEIHDPLAAHRELIGKYTDKEVHDLTAFLVTLK
jgi:cytochrome c oxidase cbb3-type subunit III